MAMKMTAVFLSMLAVTVSCFRRDISKLDLLADEDSEDVSIQQMSIDSVQTEDTSASCSDKLEAKIGKETPKFVCQCMGSRGCKNEGGEVYDGVAMVQLLAHEKRFNGCTAEELTNLCTPGESKSQQSE